MPIRRLPIRRVPKRADSPADIEALFAASTRAATLGMAVLDSQTRFQAVNEALARETQATTDFHIGRTSHEVVGDLAKQIEPTYESVLCGAAFSTVPLVGRVRNNPEVGYWLDHCFPIRDRSGRVQQLGLFVVNVTAEKASAEIFHALAIASANRNERMTALVKELEDSIDAYHFELGLSLDELVSSHAESGRKAEMFLCSIQDLDRRIRNMRELVYAVTSQFSIPSC